MWNMFTFVKHSNFQKLFWPKQKRFANAFAKQVNLQWRQFTSFVYMSPGVLPVDHMWIKRESFNCFQYFGCHFRSGWVFHDSMASGWINGALMLDGDRYSMVTEFDGTPMMSDGYFTFSRDSGNTSCIIMCLIERMARLDWISRGACR